MTVFQIVIPCRAEACSLLSIVKVIIKPQKGPEGNMAGICQKIQNHEKAIKYSHYLMILCLGLLSKSFGLAVYSWFFMYCLS